MPQIARWAVAGAHQDAAVVGNVLQQAEHKGAVGHIGRLHLIQAEEMALPHNRLGQRAQQIVVVRLAVALKPKKKEEQLEKEEEEEEEEE
mgnify:CR=1 FL=1